MSSQDNAGIALLHAPTGVGYKLLELPPELLTVLESSDAPTYVLHPFHMPAPHACIAYQPTQATVARRQAACLLHELQTHLGTNHACLQQADAPLLADLGAPPRAADGLGQRQDVRAAAEEHVERADAPRPVGRAGRRRIPGPARHGTPAAAAAEHRGDSARDAGARGCGGRRPCAVGGRRVDHRRYWRYQQRPRCRACSAHAREVAREVPEGSIAASLPQARKDGARSLRLAWSGWARADAC